MSIVVFQHEPNEPPARLGDALNHHAHRLRIIRLFAGDSVPVDLDDVDAVLSMGGSANVDETEKYPWLQPEMDYLRKAHARGKPVVGICLGAQLIATALGGKVAPMATPQVGWKPVRLSFPGQTDVLLQGLPWETMQFHLHGQEVTTLPPESMPLAGSTQCKMQAFRVGTKTYAFQYHFEWDAAQINTMLSDPLIAKAGEKPEQILARQDEHYNNYRRLGDRLCDNLAVLLFNAVRTK